jgi:DNA-binding MarR family transcriptional regulator
METFSAFKRCFMAVASEMYGDVGIGSTQVTFLRHIARHGRISQAELARATSTDPALTGRALQGLIERGVIRRQRSKSDRREYLLELGPTGKDSLAEVERVWLRLAERLVRPLDERDLKDFDRIARKLTEAFAIQSEVAEAGAPRRTERVAARSKRAIRYREHL